MPRTEKILYRFATCELDPTERRLTVDGQRITLTPKVFDTLVLLVEQAGHVVSKDDLMAALWPRGFVSESNLTKHVWLIRKALGDAGPDSRCIETVSKLGYRFVAPVQRVDAVDSEVFVGSDPALAAVDALPVALPAHVDGPHALAPGGRRWQWSAAAMTLLVLALVAAGAWRYLRPPVAAAPLAPGTAVAIVAFNNLSKNPKDAWLGSALTEMLATEVTATGKMHVLPGELVRPARMDLTVPMAGGYAPASLATLRKRLGTDYVISGGYLVSGTGTDAKVRVDVVLQDARDGAGIAEFSRAQPVSGLLALVADAGGALRAKLGLPAIGANQGKQVASAQPPSPEVARHIGFAIDALDDYDPVRARDELLLAVAQAPDYAPAYALLSRAWSDLGYHDKARGAIEQAASHAANLPEKQRLQIQAQQHVLAYDWTAAAKFYAALIALQPDDPEVRLQWIKASLSSGRIHAAESELAALRHLPSAAGDPRVELVGAQVAHFHLDRKAMLQHAERALQMAGGRNSLGQVADAKTAIGIAYGELDDTQKSQQALKEAVADYKRVGNPKGEANALKYLGYQLYYHDKTKTAGEVYQRALMIYQAIGDRGGQIMVYTRLCDVLLRDNDVDGALTAARTARDIAHETGNIALEGHALAIVAALESDRASSDHVIDEFKRAITLQRQAGDSRRIVWTLAAYGQSLVDRGDLDGAMQTCHQAWSIAAALPSLRVKEFALDGCALVESARGQVDDAVDRLKLELTTGRRANDEVAIASASTQLGQISNKRHLPEDACHFMQSEVPVFRTMGEVGGEAMMEANLALCETELGHFTKAKAAVARANQLLGLIGFNRDRFAVALPLARLRGENGQRDVAIAKLRAMAADADKRHWMASALEARLAVYRLLAQAHDPAADALHDRIESTARAHGFKWVLTRLGKGGDEAVRSLAAH